MLGRVLASKLLVYHLHHANYLLKVTSFCLWPLSFQHTVHIRPINSDKLLHNQDARLCMMHVVHHSSQCSRFAAALALSLSGSHYRTPDQRNDTIRTFGPWWISFCTVISICILLACFCNLANSSSGYFDSKLL